MLIERRRQSRRKRKKRYSGGAITDSGRRHGRGRRSRAPGTWGRRESRSSRNLPAPVTGRRREAAPAPPGHQAHLIFSTSVGPIFRSCLDVPLGPGGGAVGAGWLELEE